MFLNALLNSEILVKFHQKCGFFKYLTFNLVCLSQKWCILTKIHYIGTYMMCSKEKATFGPIFDQVLQALINTLGPQCFVTVGKVFIICVTCLGWLIHRLYVGSWLEARTRFRASLCELVGVVYFCQVPVGVRCVCAWS